MKVRAAEIANAPPLGSVIVRARGYRAEGVDALQDRCVSYVASDPSVGRDGHRILADAWETANFLQNPVFLFAHDDGAPPIGKVISLRTVGNQLRAIVRYAERDVYEFADVVYKLVTGGYLNAVSTAWIPVEWRAANDRSRPGGIDFLKVEMTELSQVPVPALPTALATARAAGINLRPLVDWTERALDLPNGLYPEKDLIMIRSAAGAARTYAAPRRPYLDRLADRQRLAQPVADPASGFRSFGEFLQCVARAEGSPRDGRLTRGPSGLAEQDQATGGFLVPTTYIDHLVESIYAESVIAPLCAQFETDRPADAQMPGVDETSRADGSRWGGATAYWDSEADSVSESLPRWKSIKFGSKKLFAVCVATNEQLADAPMLQAYVTKAFSAELSFKLDTAILRGTGAGVPLGIMAGGALITVPKVNGQSGATIISENVESMWARFPTPCRRRGVWLINEDVEQQLSAVSAGGLNPTGAALYVAAGVAGNELPLMKGRPVVVVEQAPALGTPGDIVLADLSQYAIVGAPKKVDLSLDASFATDQGVFRFVWRVDGRPLWTTPITPYNATQTRSPFVALAQR